MAQTPDAPFLERLSDWCFRDGPAVGGEKVAFPVASIAIGTGLFLSVWLIWDLFLFPIYMLLRQAGDLNHAALKHDAEAYSNAIRNSGLVYAAFIAALLAVWRSWVAERQIRAANRTLELTESRNVTDNFVKAIELLGATDHKNKPALEQRLGSIYTLERIAQENVAAYHITIMETLCAYIREHRAKVPLIEWPGAVLDALEDELTDDQIGDHPDFRAATEGTDITVTLLRNDRTAAMKEWKATHPPKLLREDLRAILDVIARRTVAQRAHEAKLRYRPDFRRLNLQGVEYHGAAFSHANMEKCRFDCADLSEAILSGSDLSFSRGYGANLGFAKLEAARFDAARLEAVEISDAQLGNTSFHGARLDLAFLYHCNATVADFARTRMVRAKLIGMVLTGARLFKTQMPGSSLLDSLVAGSSDNPLSLGEALLITVRTDGTAFRFADLSDAHLDPRTLVNSFGDASVRLPPGISPPPQWVADRVLDDAEFYGRWRGWLDRNRGNVTWRRVAPKDFRDVPGIAPPAGATWEKD